MSSISLWLEKGQTFGELEDRSSNRHCRRDCGKKGKYNFHNLPDHFPTIILSISGLRPDPQRFHLPLPHATGFVRFFFSYRILTALFFISLVISLSSVSYSQQRLSGISTPRKNSTSSQESSLTSLPYCRQSSVNSSKEGQRDCSVQSAKLRWPSIPPMFNLIVIGEIDLCMEIVTWRSSPFSSPPPGTSPPRSPLVAKRRQKGHLYVLYHH